jgi:transmembrane sensor
LTVDRWQNERFAFRVKKIQVPFGGIHGFSCPSILSPNMDNDRVWNLIAKKLAGEASSGDLKELESALRIDPDLHYSLEALNDMWKKESCMEPGQSEIAFQKHLERMRSLGVEMEDPEANPSADIFPDSPNRFTKWKIMAFLVSGFLILGLGFYFLNLKPAAIASQKAIWEVVTRNGTKTNLLLPDGSTVWLNAGSRLTYDSLYGNAVREVTLSGEAYFDVVKNPKKPFIIHTGKINIKVLGTTFNVKSYPGDRTIETSLIKGSIEVTFPSLPSKKIILKPNQKLVINKKEMISNTAENHLSVAPMPFLSVQHLNKIGSDSSFAETGWIQNRLFFNDMSFHDLLKNMERKYNVTFQIEDLSLDTVHFTGSFENETISQALDALRFTAEKSTTDFTYNVQGDHVFIYSKSTGIR